MCGATWQHECRHNLFTCLAAHRDLAIATIAGLSSATNVYSWYE